MTKNETAKILAVLKLEYPSSFKDFSPEDVEAKVISWTKQFAEYSYEEVNAAVQMLISTRTVGYSPVVGEIKEKLAMLKEPIGTNETEAWAMVSKACHNGFYGYKKEFSKLPPDVQRAVGRPEQLREWALIDEDTLETVVASNFMRTYRSVKSRNEEIKKLPVELQKAIGSMENKFQIGDGL